MFIQPQMCDTLSHIGDLGRRGPVDFPARWAGDREGARRRCYNERLHGRETLSERA